jgi:hypothetical protein
MRCLTAPQHLRMGLMVLILLALTLGACSAPVKVERVSLLNAYEDLNRIALSSDQPSEATRTVLRRAALLEMFDKDPEAAIATLRVQAIESGMHWPELYALAEMNYAGSPHQVEADVAGLSTVRLRRAVSCR